MSRPLLATQFDTFGDSKRHFRRLDTTLWSSRRQALFGGRGSTWMFCGASRPHFRGLELHFDSPKQVLNAFTLLATRNDTFGDSKRHFWRLEATLSATRNDTFGDSLTHFWRIKNESKTSQQPVKNYPIESSEFIECPGPARYNPTNWICET